MPCTLVSREAGWEVLEEPPGTPVVLAVRNDDLDIVLAKVPEARHRDLVFIQNGILRDFLRDRGLEGCTRGLLYFAVSKLGDPISPGGVNPFTGPHAEAIVDWFRRMDLEAEELSPEIFAIREFDKVCWLAVFGPLCELHGETVGEVATHRRDEVTRLAAELREVGRVALGVEVPLEELVDSLVGYSKSIPDFRAGVKEWPWRNGWLDRAAVRYGIDTSFHRDVMRRIGKGSLLEPKPEAPGDPS